MEEGIEPGGFRTADMDDQRTGDGLALTLGDRAEPGLLDPLGDELLLVAASVAADGGPVEAALRRSPFRGSSLRSKRAGLGDRRAPSVACGDTSP